MNSALLFVYNADSGVFNALADLAHKTLSPETYSCSLCRITYSSFGMRREWKRFLHQLGTPVEFLHRDELSERYGVEGVPLPAVFRRADDERQLWLDADALNACGSMADLQQLIRSGPGREED